MAKRSVTRKQSKKMRGGAPETISTNAELNASKKYAKRYQVTYKKTVVEKETSNPEEVRSYLKDKWKYTILAL